MLGQIGETGLLVAVAIAVLAFGGTAPQFFALTQGMILFLGILCLLEMGRSHSHSIRRPVTAPILLIAFVLLQVIPLPAALGRALGAPPTEPLGHSYFTLSAAPYETVSHLLLLVTYLTAFYLVLEFSGEQKPGKRIVFALISVGVFEAFYGLIQYLTGWQQIFAYVKKFYLQDATGTYINRNHFAGFLEMILPFAVALALQQVWALRRKNQKGRGLSREILSSKEFPLLVFWICVAALLFAALISSHSRMGIISAFVALVAVLVLAGTASMSVRLRIAVGVLFLLSISGLALWIGSDPVIDRFETLGQQYSRPGQDRMSIWRDTLNLIRRHPVVGSGLGTFAIVYPSVQTAFLNNLVDHAHCDYLEVVTELGLPGGVVIFGAILCVLGRSIRHARQSVDAPEKAISLGCSGSIVAILLHSATDFNLYIPANALVFVVILAVAWSNAHRKVAPSGGKQVDLRRSQGEQNRFETPVFANEEADFVSRGAGGPPG